MLSLSLLLLSGCVSVGVTSASLIYDNYALNNSVQNHLLDLKADHKVDALEQEKSQHSNITAVTYDQVVLLLGQTDSPMIRKRAGELVSNIPGVQRVFNQITIGPEISLAQKLKDVWLTTKLRAKFIAVKELNATLFKIVTENSVVYLMGTVPKIQADIAVYVAKHTRGVKKVVKALRQTIVINEKPKKLVKAH